MPIIKSAKKRVKQAEKRRQRNYPLRSLMKTNIKKVLTAVAQGNKEEAEKLLPTAYKTIDMAAKKNIIHDKNADNKKSRLARAIARIGEAKVATKKVKTSKKSKPAKKKVDTKEIKEEKDVKETSTGKTEKVDKKEEK